MAYYYSIISFETLLYHLVGKKNCGVLEYLNFSSHLCHWSVGFGLFACYKKQKTHPLYFRSAMETSTHKQGWGSLLELCALWQVIMRIKSDKKDLII